jgi:hypothetical protein
VDRERQPREADHDHDHPTDDDGELAPSGRRRDQDERPYQCCGGGGVAARKAEARHLLGAHPDVGSGAADHLLEQGVHHEDDSDGGEHEQGIVAPACARQQRDDHKRDSRDGNGVRRLAHRDHRSVDRGADDIVQFDQDPSVAGKRAGELDPRGEGHEQDGGHHSRSTANTSACHLFHGARWIAHGTRDDRHVLPTPPDHGEVGSGHSQPLQWSEAEQAGGVVPQVGPLDVGAWT